MRQLLISVVLILLIVMTALCIKNGVNIGKLHVLGISQIQEENDELTEAITEAQTANADYSNRLTILKTEISKLISAKEECLQLINVSSESQLEQATQTKNYTIEYLWSKLGNHATQEGVDIKIDVVNGTISNSDYRNLKFTVNGSYLAITNFITAIENDSSLQFTIDDFSMVQNQCTFTVKNVKIKRESTTQNSLNMENNSSNESTDDEENTVNTDTPGGE